MSKRVQQFKYFERETLEHLVYTWCELQLSQGNQISDLDFGALLKQNSTLDYKVEQLSNAISYHLYQNIPTDKGIYSEIITQSVGRVSYTNVAKEILHDLQAELTMKT